MPLSQAQTKVRKISGVIVTSFTSLFMRFVVKFHSPTEAPLSQLSLTAPLREGSQDTTVLAESALI